MSTSGATRVIAPRTAAVASSGVIEVLPVLKPLVDRPEQPRAVVTVRDAVVGGECRRQLWTRDDLSIDDGRTDRDLTEADQRDLRRMDDPGDRVDALVAEVGDGRCRVGQI